MARLTQIIQEEKTDGRKKGQRKKKTNDSQSLKGK